MINISHKGNLSLFTVFQMYLMCQFNFDAAGRQAITMYCVPILRKLESHKMAKLASTSVENEIEEPKQQGTNSQYLHICTLHHIYKLCTFDLIIKCTGILILMYIY